MAITEHAQPPHERQAAILERIATNAPLQKTLDELVRYVEDQLPGASGSLLLIEPDGRRLRYAAGYRLPAAHNTQLGSIEIGASAGSCGTAAFRRTPVFVTDIASDPLWADYRELAQAHDLHACWSTPILSRRRLDHGGVLGTLAVYFQAPRAPEPAHRDLLAHVEHLACIALEADYAARELRESDTRLRMFVDHATDGFFVHDGMTGAVVG